MGLVETFMPEEKVEVTLSQIEGLIRDKERATANYKAILGLCEHNIDPVVIYEIFAGKAKNEVKVNDENVL